MAQNVVIREVVYQNVPSVEIPLSGESGNAVFIDTSDATLNSNAQMLSGVSAYSDGVKYTGSIVSKSSTDLTESGATVTAPAGYYASNATKTITSGSATPAASISSTGASVSTGTNTLTLSKSVSNTPTVSAGYVSTGTAGNSSVSLTASVTTKAAATITPTTSNIEIAAGTYLTGKQTISGDATIAVTIGGGGTTITWYKKVNGSWVSQGNIAKVYKKINGSWVEQSDIASAISSSTNYVVVQN